METQTPIMTAHASGAEAQTPGTEAHAAGIWTHATTDNKKKTIIIAIAIAAVVAIAAIMITATALTGQTTTTEPGTQIAATVNGYPIYESAVTQYVADFRSNNSLTNDDTWSAWLLQQQLTPATYRSKVIKDDMEKDTLLQQSPEYMCTYGDGLHAIGPVPTDAQLQQFTQANLADYLQDNDGVDYTLPANGQVVYSDVPQDLRDIMAGMWSRQQMRGYVLGNIAQYVKDNDPGDYNLPVDAAVDYDNIPQRIVKDLQDQWITQNESTVSAAYLQSVQNNAKVVIYDMPSGLPYDITQK
jgi:hypothetical protein